MLFCIHIVGFSMQRSPLCFALKAQSDSAVPADYSDVRDERRSYARGNADRCSFAETA